MVNQRVCEKKYLSWVFGVDRKIRHSGSVLGIFLSRPAVSAYAQKAISKCQSLLYSTAHKITHLNSTIQLAATCHANCMQNEPGRNR